MAAATAFALLPGGTTHSQYLSHSTLPELGGDAVQGWNTGCHQVSLFCYQHQTDSPCPGVAASLAYPGTPLWYSAMCTGQPEPWGLPRKVRAEPWP